MIVVFVCLQFKGMGGRISAGGSSIGSYMRKVAAIEGGYDKDEDPREAILKYAKVARLFNSYTLYIHVLYTYTCTSDFFVFRLQLRIHCMLIQLIIGKRLPP